MLITTSWVIYEALTLLKSHIGSPKIDLLWEIANDPTLVSLARVTDAIEAAALRLFFEHRDKTWGVVDGTSLIVMAESGCRQRGFRVIPETSAHL